MEHLPRNCGRDCDGIGGGEGMNMRKALIALALSVLKPQMPEFEIKPASIGYLKQHPSMRLGKSGVAAAKRAARKRKARKC